VRTPQLQRREDGGLSQRQKPPRRPAP
jgi:hypothetical protein